MSASIINSFIGLLVSRYFQKGLGIFFLDLRKCKTAGAGGVSSQFL